MNSVQEDGAEKDDVTETAVLERKVILVAAVVAMIGGFFHGHSL